MYRIPSAWQTDEHGARKRPAEYATARDVVRDFGSHMVYGQALTFLYANGVDPDDNTMAFTSGRTVSTRHLCRAIRRLTPIAA